MRRQRTLHALLLTVGICSAPFSARAQEKDHASWWITNYGLVDSAKEPLAARARTIFDRLAAAADKRANRFPKLAVLDADGNPLAMALPDGTVLLTRGALHICYRKVAEPVGDARLAFIIGHELSHLGNDDFWHAAAFDTLNRHGDRDVGLDTVWKAIKDSAEAVVERELQADAYGMLYMTMAGYDPALLLGRESFFEDWSADLDRLGVRYMTTHPEPEERAAFLRAQLAAVASELDVFHFGVRLVQLGRFEDGLVLLERFRGRFASREVLNDIGFAELALALAYLDACDDSLLRRFRLPLALDPETLAAKADTLGRVPRVRAPGSTSTQCMESLVFDSHFKEAERSFRLARERDPSYAPAQLNLASALLVVGRGTEALNEVNEALKRFPGDDNFAMLQALALYLTGQENNVDTVDAAVAALEALQDRRSDVPAIAYNRARILSERGRVAASMRAWRRFLELEPTGDFAEEARQWVSAPRPQRATDRESSTRRLPQPPIPLGTQVRDVRLKGGSSHEIREGRFQGSILLSGRIKALAINDVIEIVELAAEDSRSPERVYGPADRVQQEMRADLFFYPGLMVEFTIGSPRLEVFFLGEGEERF